MITPTQIQYGPLQCIQIDSGDAPEIAVVLCHGYGAPGHDLAGIGPEWIRLLKRESPRVRFVFPAAPHTLAELGMPDGRAWWQLNMARLQLLFETQQFDELHTEEPPGMVDSRDLLCETITAVKSELQGDKTPLVLGGFSQGAMLTMDVATCGDIAPPQALIQFSGTVVRENQWRGGLSRLENTTVYQSHGTADPILPFTSAQRLHEMFDGAGVENEFHEFNGPHTIDAESIKKTAALIDQIGGQ